MIEIVMSHHGTEELAPEDKLNEKVWFTLMPLVTTLAILAVAFYGWRNAPSSSAMEDSAATEVHESH